MNTRLYVSMDALNRGTVIRRAVAPTTQAELATGGIYSIGPFRTRRAADICASGQHPYSVQCVAQWERMARKA